MRKGILVGLVGALLAAVAIAAGPTTAVAQKKAPSERPCTVAERDEGNRQAFLNQRDTRFHLNEHLPWGAPVDQTSRPSERVLVLRDYANLYSTTLRVPIWSAERIDEANLDNLPQRIKCFRGHPRLTAAENATDSDYVEEKGADVVRYDQGHMTNAADQEQSVSAQVNSFFFTNMAPQTCEFNRGIWQILEGIVRLWAKEDDPVFVLAGSVFDRDANGRRDPDSAAEHIQSRNGQRRVAVPSHFYKIVARQMPNGRVRTLSILMPHNTANPEGAAARQYLRDHITTVAAIERVTGFNLFPNQSNVDESTDLWPFPENQQPRSLCH